MVRGPSHSSRSGSFRSPSRPSGGGFRGGPGGPAGGGFGGGPGGPAGGGFGGGIGAPHGHAHHNPVHHRHFFRPFTFHWFGRPVIFTTGIQSALLVIFMLVVICAFGIFGSSFVLSSKNSTLNSYNSEIAVYEADATFYSNMIQSADADGTNGYYITTATFSTSRSSSSRTGYYHYLTINGVSYYYIVYEYTNEITGQPTYGETYTQFTSSQINSMINSATGTGEIEIAYGYDTSDNTMASINTSYKLELNQDYNELLLEISNLENQKKNTVYVLTAFSLIGVVFVVVIILIIVRTIKRSKKQAELDEAKAEAEIAEATAKAETARAEASQKNRYCTYCGSSVPDGATKCPNCGSTIFKK